MTSKEESNIQENLVKLYLRLNGYFTTGFIIHSNKNKIKSETDKTQKEIILLGQLLDSLKSPLPDQDFIRKYLPYYGEGTERMLRSLLRENKQLINKIINKE